MNSLLPTLALDAERPFEDVVRLHEGPEKKLHVYHAITDNS